MQTQTLPVTQPYRSKYKIRIVTAASLFDGHDAAINLMRRILQSSGAEVIHLGHNRSAHEIVTAALQEDVQAVALSSYQGGHMEFFTYIRQLLDEAGASHIRIFGGGGGTILPTEIETLHQKGITRIYAPDDGRTMGLQGMINDILQKSDFAVWENTLLDFQALQNFLGLARALSALENMPESYIPQIQSLYADHAPSKAIPVVGITGVGGAGKSSLVDEIVQRFLRTYPDKKIAILSVDPSKRKSGGALLGDRLRMNSIYHPHVYMRSFATRVAHRSLPTFLRQAVALTRLAGFDLILLETAGIGQADTEITEHADINVYVMTPEFGAPTQLEKIDMLEYADLVVLNKFDKRGAQDALYAICKQYQRNHKLFNQAVDEMPVYPTLASQFNDPGVNRFFEALFLRIRQNYPDWEAPYTSENPPTQITLIPPSRERYLGEIVHTVRAYNQQTDTYAALARKLYQLQGAQQTLSDLALQNEIEKEIQKIKSSLPKDLLQQLENWDEEKSRYTDETYAYTVRDKTLYVKTYHESLSHTRIPKIAPPNLSDWGDRVRWLRQENYPGKFPYTAGVYPFKRTEEDPTRMFAGEGTPERTNRRFHYLAAGIAGARLSTAFDSVTLYGQDPHTRPDIYGKIGNSGVSIPTLTDIKKLYSGFRLADPKTSVSMTINGPAPIILAMFLNAAIDQECEIYIRQHGLADHVTQKIQALYTEKGLPLPTYEGSLPDRHNGLGLMLLGVSGDEVLPAEVYHALRDKTLQQVRGTVQADILKEDQAQNTCIFAIDFALRMMGDIQAYFIEKKVKNFYSVSISGYHIAEAGANPITQLAFTLANGFTYLEYYLARGMYVDDFAPNFSFFFSNGMDPEYAVIGRVARRIWAKALRYLYGANPRSQMLKYHIQTSGRSLHAQEIDFNDIRTTLQALYALADNCNSLHTNAYDEAITTPTEESVRRALAIQLIINKELGLTKNENPWQGSFFLEWLTDKVEEAVLQEFERLNERGGVLGAMETSYQRNKIQEDSLYYETLKHSGQLPIIGVNTFLAKDGSPTKIPNEVIRSSDAEKQQQIRNLQAFHTFRADKAPKALQELQRAALRGENIFATLMETVKYASLGQITHTLYAVGGQYRRNL
ncbi:MAG: methylmalonyl-CoA mutase family protein [Bacteroidia bacterium]